VWQTRELELSVGLSSDDETLHVATAAVDHKHVLVTLGVLQDEGGNALTRGCGERQVCVCVCACACVCVCVCVCVDVCCVVLCCVVLCCVCVCVYVCVCRFCCRCCCLFLLIK
jgi:hypothetical protein